jgi:hypothetical protein
MKRREFLKRTAMVTAGAAAAASGVSLVGYAASDSMQEPAVLTAHESATLLAMARQLFPHDKVSDASYRKVVEDLADEAKKTPETATLLHDGVARLDKVQDAKFVTLSPDDQIVALKKIESTPFFQKVRTAEIVSLYNNHELWKQFGYPGASYQIGGYLHHGFDDLKWLPDPPESASPKPA